MKTTNHLTLNPFIQSSILSRLYSNSFPFHFKKLCTEKMKDDKTFIHNLEEEYLSERKFVVEFLLK